MKIFIIGCGRIFLKHIESIKALGEKKFKIVGISDKDKRKILNFSKQLSVPGFLDYKKGIQKTNPDIVSVLTPSGYHASHIMGSLKLKKHVICEKPMCLKVSDAKKIIKFSKTIKKKVYVVMQNKFNTPVVKLIKDIKKKKFCKIFHASVIVRWRRDQSYYNQHKWRGTWKFDGGVISNQASHHLDLLRTIMGEPTSLFAKSEKHLAKIQAEDTALIIFNFKNKKTAIMEATTAMRPKNIEGSLSVLGSIGSAKVGGFALNKFSFYNTKIKTNISKYNTLPKSVYGFGHYQFYRHIFHCLSNNIKSEFEANEAIKTVKLINAIYKSIESKKEIFLKKNINSKKLGK
jgi:predicted dehydrogenase